MVCPHAAGAKNWLPASYNRGHAEPSSCRSSRRAWICSRCRAAARGGLSSGVNWGIRPRPDSDGNYGRLQAIDLGTREDGVDRRASARRRRRACSPRPAASCSRARSTAYLRAYDAADGTGALGDAPERRVELAPDHLRRRTASSTSRSSPAKAAFTPAATRRSCRRFSKPADRGARCGCSRCRTRFVDRCARLFSSAADLHHNGPVRVSLRRARGWLLRAVLRRHPAVCLGVLLVVPAAWLWWADHSWESWATDGLTLVLGGRGRR